jgi:hypothetical protein
MIPCKNCQQPVAEKFCPRCGQKASVARITLKRFFIDLPHAVFHLDSGFLFNVWELFKRPGIAIREYLGGKRKPFYHPASYLVIALIVNYLVVKITNLHFYDEGELVTMHPLAAKAIIDYDAMQWWFLEHTYVYILVAITTSSLFLFGIFRLMKMSFNLAETAAIVLFTIAQGVLIQSAIYLSFGWIHSGPIIRTIESVNTVILISYASYVMYQLITTARNTMIRLSVSVLAGLGLAVVWIATAYLLYLLFT